MRQSTAVLNESTIDEARWRALASEHFCKCIAVQQHAAGNCLDAIVKGASILADCFSAGNKILICGNGGSAADAQHMAAEFVSRYSRDIDRPGLPAIALTTDTSILTAQANDHAWEEVFERQVLALGRRGDVLIAISTSGNSANVIRAVKAATDNDVITIGLLGEGGRLTQLVSHSIVIQSRDTQHIQEALLTVEHILCMLVEQKLYGES
jgi:D-sedoheptulose 7-phosphate isomerase